VFALQRPFPASLDGLTPAAAAGLLERYGPNHIDIGRATPAWAILAAQFRSVIVLLLVVATAVAWAIGDALEAAAVGAVLVINAAIGFFRLLPVFL
jgi:Ca2+-transporting ATPase